MTETNRNVQPINLADVIKTGIEVDRGKLHTMLPATVITYDETTQEASVQINVTRRKTDAGGQVSPLPVPPLLDVPVRFHRSQGFAITFPIAAGDEGFVIFSEADMSAWLRHGGDRPPQSGRRHSYSDAVFEPGLTTKGGRLSGVQTDSLDIRNAAGTSYIRLLDDGTIEMLSTSTYKIKGAVDDLVAMFEELIDTLKTLEIDLDNQAPGNIRLLSDAYVIILEAMRARADALKA